MGKTIVPVDSTRAYTGISTALPLETDDQDGHYALNKTLTQVVLQNLRVLFKTCPGERVWNPHFGIGLRNYLFDQDTSTTRINLDANIREQVAKFIPIVRIVDLRINSPLNNPAVPSNQLSIDFLFTIGQSELMGMTFESSEAGGGVISSSPKDILSLLR